MVLVAVCAVSEVERVNTVQDDRSTCGKFVSWAPSVFQRTVYGNGLLGPKSAMISHTCINNDNRSVRVKLGALFAVEN